MELNKHHRQALICRLKDNLANKETLQFAREQRTASGEEQLLAWNEVDRWVNENLQELLETALENNELDNF